MSDTVSVQTTSSGTPTFEIQPAPARWPPGSAVLSALVNSIASALPTLLRRSVPISSGSERHTSDLYDNDILLWSERQVELLRRRATGELVNDAEIDWQNIAEEIEDVGKSAVNAVISSLENILRHRIYLLGWPNSLSGRKWQTELKAFVRTLRRNYTPSMTGTGKVTDADVRELYTDAVEYSLAHIDTPPEIEIPAECPWALSEIIADSTARRVA